MKKQAILKKLTLSRVLNKLKYIAQCLISRVFQKIKAIGALRRKKPLSEKFGADRGQPIDRYYIDIFLDEHQETIKGHVLEIGDMSYTKKFGKNKVLKNDILHATTENKKATIVADLTSADHIPSNTFDCIILTQTLQFIYDVKAAVKTVHRILKPGGVVLATMSGISKISRYDMDRWGEYWRFTPLSAEKIFEETFLKKNITTQAHGNVLVALSFLHGYATRELRKKQLNYVDQDYPVIITVKAIKEKE